MRLTDTLFFDGDFQQLKKYYNEGYSLTDKVKFFLGYSGWTEGQLQNEIKENSWLVNRSISSEKMMAARDEMFWKQSLIRMGGKYKTWAKFPIDPDLN